MLREIRIHGRGGQGAATAGEILALAAFYEGKYAQSFPYFGPERRGAPVVAFTRIDGEPIRLRTEIHNPDCLVVLDQKLVRAVNITDDLKSGGTIVLNTLNEPSDLPMQTKARKIAVVDATEIALKTIGAPITNTAMLGAFSSATHWIGIEAVCKAITSRFSKDSALRNVDAARMAYEKTEIVTKS